MTEERKFAILFAATILAARKLIDMDPNKPNMAKGSFVDKAIEDAVFISRTNRHAMAYDCEYVCGQERLTMWVMPEQRLLMELPTSHRGTSGPRHWNVAGKLYCGGLPRLIAGGFI